MRNSVLKLILVLALVASLSPGVSAQKRFWTLADAVTEASQYARRFTVGIETRFDYPRNPDKFFAYSMFAGGRPLKGLQGSGFFYKDTRYVITNADIVEDASIIRVVLDNGHSYEARLVGKSTSSGVAVLEVKIPPFESIPAPVFTDSDKLRLGEPIALIGRSLDSIYYSQSVVGVISAIRKEVPGAREPTDQYLQFDASYELGYKGGPLVNINGEIVGMATDPVLVRINLAIPSNLVVRAVERILIGETREAWLGWELLPLTSQIRRISGLPKDQEGLFVTYVAERGPATAAGVNAGDVILAINDRKLKYIYDYNTIFKDFIIGQNIKVDLLSKVGNTYQKRSLVVQVQVNPESLEEEGKDVKEESYHHH